MLLTSDHFLMQWKQNMWSHDDSLPRMSTGHRHTPQASSGESGAAVAAATATGVAVGVVAGPKWRLDAIEGEGQGGRQPVCFILSFALALSFSTLQDSRTFAPFHPT